MQNYKWGDLMSGIFTIAVHALVYLNHRGETISSEELAQNICTNPARVRKVMAMLSRNGLVKTYAGSHGGYCFVLAPESVTLRSICEAVGDPPVPAGWHSGGIDLPCLIASGMSGVMDGIRTELNAACYQRLAGITIADIDRSIFGAKGGAVSP